MPVTHFYYHLKPYLPWGFRVVFRRLVARWQRRAHQDTWPINEAAGRPPEDWPGWPDGKKFALVLTHDVKGPDGLAKCRQLMELEIRLGFRSSFNFIPEGDYAVSRELREELAQNGFEVGVQDLRHDGMLFQNRETFRQGARQINHYLREWNAVGFRSAFMFHNLEWAHDLDVDYSSCTFDTDPFEPQPSGVDTIFPFWVPQSNLEIRYPKSENGNSIQPSPFALPSHLPRATRHTSPASGYVELPYTLPQDSTLFLLLREKQPDIWFKKLAWLAERGGMVLLNVHPDYMAMDGEASLRNEYPVQLYERFLKHVRLEYSGSYWHALPKEAARYVRQATSSPNVGSSRRPNGHSPAANHRPKIWIDLDNTPHVPFFEPIMEELRLRGFRLLVTARDAFQVCALADKKGLEYLRIGRHYGKSRIRKAVGLLYRALQLFPVVSRERPALGVSHGARSQLLIGNGCGIPTLLLEDYEHAKFPRFMRPTWVMAPTVIPDAALCARNGNIRKYGGIKEDVYAWKMKPDPAILKTLGLGDSELIVTVRPPATEAHYHNPESEALFEAFMSRACDIPETRLVLLPRNAKQGDLIRQRWPQWFSANKTVVPNGALDGLNLIWHSDLVVSGGGTMNREAAALGVPVYSIFRGPIGAVDRKLQSEGRLILIETISDVQTKILLARRARKSLTDVTSRKTLLEIVDTIQEIVERPNR